MTFVAFYMCPRFWGCKMKRLRSMIKFPGFLHMRCREIEDIRELFAPALEKADWYLDS